jgi:transcriptional regulator of arginine metabolism
MAVDIQQASLRRAAILRIIRDSAVRKQEELVKRLRKEGFDATQSSVSRDLRELGVAKAADRYIVPGAGEVVAIDPFAAVASFVLDVRTAGPSLCVIKTTAGSAQSVASAIDQARWSEIAGTIAGDDTIFIAIEDVRAQRKLTDRLRTTFRL